MFNSLSIDVLDSFELESNHGVIPYVYMEYNNKHSTLYREFHKLLSGHILIEYKLRDFDRLLGWSHWLISESSVQSKVNLL